jgi:hypothetical protein
MTTDFLQILYTREETVVPSLILDLFLQQVDAEMNAKLCAPFLEKEINDALFQIGPLKAPGPDGFTACFLLCNWVLL